MIFLLMTSIAAAVFQTSIFNYIGKSDCKTTGDSYLFNAISYVLCIAIFIVLTITGKASWFSVGLGLLYGIMNAVSNGYALRAYGAGPMHVTILLLTSAMIIPTMSGFLFFGEPFSLIKLLGIVFLLFFIYLSLNKNDDGKKLNRKWLLYCLLSFLATGMIGILQKVHQSSAHKEETAAFLLAGFACSFIYAAIMSKKYNAQIKPTLKIYLLAAVCGLSAFAMHYLNLGLSGKLPSQLFFPLVNAGPMILNIIVSATVFKEKITVRQIVGITGGILSLGCICMLG